MSQKNLKLALKKQSQKYPTQSKSILAGAISAVLVGVYGMPVRADNDYRSPGGITVSRGSYKVGDNDIFSGNGADSTTVAVDFAVGEKWRGRINYENTDGETRLDRTVPAAYTSGGPLAGYNLFRVNDKFPTLQFDTVDFEAGYEITLGEYLSLMPTVGLRYTDLELTQTDTVSSYISGGAGSISFRPVPAAYIPPALAPAINGTMDQKIKAYGLTLGLDSQFNLSENWSISADLGADYLFAKRDINATLNLAAIIDASDSDWVPGINGNISIDYHLTQASDYDAGFVVSLGYHYQTWYDMMIENTSGDKADVELQGGYLKLAVNF